MYEDEESRLKRLAEYETCKSRGHDATGMCGLGPYSICRYCGVHFRFITTMEEAVSSLPTKVYRHIEGTNMFVYDDAPEA